MAQTVLFRNRRITQPGVYADSISAIATPPLALDTSQVMIVDFDGSGDDSPFGPSPGMVPNLTQNNNKPVVLRNYQAALSVLGYGYWGQLIDAMFRPAQGQPGISEIHYVKVPGTGWNAAMHEPFAMFGTAPAQNATDYRIKIRAKRLSSRGMTVMMSSSGAFRRVNGIVAAFVPENGKFRFYILRYNSQGTYNGQLINPQEIATQPQYSGIYNTYERTGTSTINTPDLATSNGMSAQASAIANAVIASNVASNLRTLNSDTSDLTDLTLSNIGPMGIVYRSLSTYTTVKEWIDSVKTDTNFTDNYELENEKNSMNAIAEASFPSTVVTNTVNSVPVTTFMDNAPILQKLLTASFPVQSTEVIPATTGANPTPEMTRYITTQTDHFSYFKEFAPNTAPPAVLNADIARALESVRNSHVNFVYLLHGGQDRAANTTVSPAITAYDSTRLSTKNSLVVDFEFKYRKIFYASTSEKELNIDNEEVTLVHGGCYKFVNNVRHLFDPSYKAALILGREAGLPPEIPITFKSLGFDLDGMDLAFDDREDLLDKGILYTYFDEDLNRYAIGAGINTLQRNDFPTNPDGTTYIKQRYRMDVTLLRDLNINILQTFFAGNEGANTATVSDEDLTSAIASYLQAQIPTEGSGGSVISFQDISIQREGGSRVATFGVRYNNEVDKIFLLAIRL